MAKGKAKRSSPRTGKGQGRQAGGAAHPRELPGAVREFVGISLLAAGIFVLASLLSFQGGDGTLMGPVGRFVAGALYASVGMGGYLVGLGLLLYGAAAVSAHRVEVAAGEVAGFALSTLAGCVLLHVTFPDRRLYGYTAGGLVGELVGEVSLGLFSLAGTYLVSVTIFTMGLLASTPLSGAHLLRAGGGVRRLVAGAGAYLLDGAKTAFDFGRSGIGWPSDEGAEDRDRAFDHAAADEEEDEDWEGDPEEEDTFEPRVIEPRVPADDPSSAAGEGSGSRRGAAGPGRRRRAKAARRVRRGDGRDGEGESEPREEPPSGTPPADDPTALREPQAGNGAAPAPRKTAQRREAGAPPGSRSASPETGGEAAPQIVMPETEDPTTPKNGAKKPPPRPGEVKGRPGAKAATPPAKAARTASKDREGIVGVKWLTAEPYRLPPVELFEAAVRKKTKVDEAFVLDQARRLVNVLAQFKVPGKVTKIHPGPVITRYEFKPEPGVKLSRIESLESDIAMALEAIRIRILAPIPGKATVGFEVPNKVRETVYIKELLDAEGFGAGCKLPLALGKDIVGKPQWIDLAKAPHLLVAGATGSGKSVGVNAMISSLLYTASPEDVRMIMIDPKMLELSIYEGIPHLLLPVVTDAEKANLALRWAVEEMERRYALLSKAKVRDLTGYNRKIPELVEAWEAECRAIRRAAEEARAAAAEGGEDAACGGDLPGIEVASDGSRRPVGGEEDLPPKPSKLPYIVMVIDEFADLMMVASKEVEQNVARIAAKARAAGIHMILATQRPSVDVITGTIKNNFPSRIAFQVTSDADSRTILDAKGAKQLLGMGDMLYMDRGRAPQRIHGCFVSEEEILRIARFIKQQAKPVYNMDIVCRREERDEDGDENVDPLYDKAVRIVAEAGKVSTSMLQRRLNIGYNRAAKIVERMEAQGVIGPARGSSPREVYITAA